MNARTTDESVSVSLLALPDSTPTALYGLYEIFAAVGRVWSELTGEPAAAREMDVRIVSPTRTPFACAMGAVISPHASLDETARTDVVVITDLALAMGMDPRGRWPDVANWVRMQFEGGATVCSVCTGSVLLAEAGLLDGREATSHWSAAGVFDAYYPAVSSGRNASSRRWVPTTGW
jgi:transcriptional regulator GlxA family with amidase domain